MREIYSSDIYLTPTDLNEIENEIERVTNLAQQYFSSDNMSLRNIQVGDNLSGKTIYLSFPRNIYESINNTDYVNIISCGTTTRGIRCRLNNNKHYIGIGYGNPLYYIYAKNEAATNPYLNYVSIKLPNDFGVVTEINSNSSIYQYIKIYDNECNLPNYVKNTHSLNDILTMRKIDNIEKGIQNIGDYIYKQNGWVNGKEWLGSPILMGNNNYGVVSKPISYIDLNRWVNNLKLITFDNINDYSIWNTNLSKINWNVDNEIEWEDN